MPKIFSAATGYYFRLFSIDLSNFVGHIEVLDRKKE